MVFNITDDKKDEAIKNMTKSLAALRTMLHMTQSQLSELMGITRQTLVGYETGKRRMSWSTFLVLLFIFDNCEVTKPILKALKIYPVELELFFNQICEE